MDIQNTNGYIAISSQSMIQILSAYEPQALCQIRVCPPLTISLALPLRRYHSGL